ncbi:tryptophan synthase subunit alpha [Pacificibacter marinus]|uniref:tryptophan synthase subunit alpha n=1 Tax=Pacificibacter marinus TaxID=658057 RepID=UPI001C0799D4|nr:tryptophan synthase subunit alpha [Pacificibacter marinus]MBU2868374.1 tryptophan synthase subunit alpha [Pacificibacter marinus]
MARPNLKNNGLLSQREAPVLSCYFPLGDPKVPVDLVDIYADHGVDVLEIGLASDHPFLDGPDVSASMKRADVDRARKDLDRVMNHLSKRRVAPKILLMGYVEQAHKGREDTHFWSGIDSFLSVGCSNEHIAQQIEKTAIGAGVAPSVFVGWPIVDHDIDAVRKATFYVMLQAGAGQTGPRKELDPENRQRILQLRDAGVDVPILLGFGISNGAQAREAISLGADGVVVGSQVLRAALEGDKVLKSLFTDLRSGLDA